MAATDAAQLSALATASQKPNRAPSPPHSKREKKRQVLGDKLTALEEEMSRDRDKSYREELQRIQVGVNLVTRVDAYSDRPLEDVLREYRALSHPIMNGAERNGAERNTRSLLEMAGPSFTEWLDQVEDLVETRDYELTTQKHQYDRKVQSNYNTHAYRVDVAKREHKALSNTLKDRLINVILSKKGRLSKEKDALEISDASALLLHPNQYSFTSPSSPGGTHSKRTTRQRREVEEHSSYLESKKRKRNAGEDDGSPVPIRKAFDTSSTTPLWQNDKFRIRQETGPIYSIDKLFTDKELSMTHNAAAMAAYKHLLTRRDANGNVIPTPDESEAGGADGHEDQKDDDLAAPTMERQPSHQTRSTRGGQNTNAQNFYDDKILGIEGLANFEIAGNLERLSAQEPKLPPVIHSQYSKGYSKTETNTPAALSGEDANQDLMVMNVFKQFQRKNGVGTNIDQPNGGRKLLEAMSEPQRRSPHVAYLQRRPRPSVMKLAESLDVPTSSLQSETGPETSNIRGMPSGAAAAANNASPAAAPPMSRQSSLGGVAMSRSGSGRGKRRP